MFGSPDISCREVAAKRGAIEALRGPQACVAGHAATYEARRDTLIDGLARPGPAIG